MKWLKYGKYLCLLPVAAFGIYGMVHFWRDLFGSGDWASGGNMVAWVICGTLSFGWLHAQEHARHLQKMLQSQQHHDMLIAKVSSQHDEVKNMTAAQSEDLKAHMDAIAGNTNGQVH